MFQATMSQARDVFVKAAFLLLGGGFFASVAGQTVAPSPQSAQPESPPKPSPATSAPPEATSPAAADAAAVPGDEEPTIWQEISESIVGGTFSLNLRFRAEIAEQSELDTSQAYTQRIRLGYGTKAFHGLSFFIEVEDIHSANEDLYNAAGLNNQPNKTVIADPEASELNQYFVKYSNEFITGIAGRQRITLDNHRFIGNVGWRQNEQTYDAYTLTSEWIKDVRLFYSYVANVNRIFGPEAHRDFQSNSHLLNAAWSGWSFGTLAAFAYFLDFDNSPANSSNSVGARFNGSTKAGDDFVIGYDASYAFQVDAENNPANYLAHYYMVEGTLGYQKLFKVGAGYEVLGSQGGAASFQTPLATLHAFNGWADVFLVTPPDGLEDLYFLAGGTLPLDIQALGYYHLFFSEDRSTDFGGEFDALLSKKLTKNISLLGKLAIFHAKDDRFPNHLQRYWIQAEVAF